jgi:integrase
MVARVPVKGVKRYKDRHGKWRCYHRKTGKPIKAEYGTAEFIREVEALEKQAKASGPVPGTLGEVIKRYLDTPHFKEGLAEATQVGYRRYLAFLDPIGDLPIRNIDAPFLANLRDGLTKDRGQRQANYVLSVLHNVFKFAVERKLARSNPVPDVARVKRPKNKRKANRPWTLEERRAVLLEAPWQIKVPLALAMFTGLRKRDCLTMEKGAIQGGRLNTSKTGEEVFLPLHPGLLAILDAAPIHKGKTIAANSRGEPWTESGFNSVWDRFKDRLEAEGKVGPHLTIHGLRHTVGSMLADAETGLDDIRRTLGQKTLAMAQHYSERAKKEKTMRRVVDSLDPLGTRECLTGVSNPDGSGKPLQ